MIYTDDGTKININNLSLLSTQGSEVIAYNDENTVYKIYRDDYKFAHKFCLDLDYLSSLKTSRILMPESKLFQDKKLVGYTMKLVSNPNNILDAPMSSLLDELSIIQNDIETISKANVRLFDINKSNYIYNGGLYFIDPGNYYINNLDGMFYRMANKRYFLDEETKTLQPVAKFDDASKLEYVRKWNYSKINSAIHEMLFMNNPDIDIPSLRKTIEFFRESKKEQGELFDLSIYKKYFDSSLSVGNAVKEFAAKNIHIDQNEKKEINSLFTK